MTSDVRAKLDAVITTSRTYSYGPAESKDLAGAIKWNLGWDPHKKF